MGKRIGARIIALIPAIILQIVVIVLLLTVLKPVSAYAYLVLEIIGIITTIGIISVQEAPAYKQVWTLFILTVPVFGILMYLMFANKKTGKKLERNLEQSRTDLAWSFPVSKDIGNFQPEPGMLRTSESVYSVMKTTGMGVYRCGDTRYYPVGEACLSDYLEDLKKAEETIYLEYFIVNEGTFLNSITDILEEKVKAGVDVRFMYDDLGSIATFSKENVKKLTDAGIKVLAFNPITYVTPRVNNRDHRKMTVIDGKIAYSGGINLSDEYINIGSKYGHWKDLAFRLEGDAVINYAFMYIEFWNAFSEDKISRDYLPEACSDSGNNGYILSYYENPVGDYHVSNYLYLDFLTMSTDHIWFYTPYLMLDDSLLYGFINAAQRGVDVRVILPGIPDKKIAYRIARSYYGPLLKAGVRIFEYTPGFIHAKACVCDGKVGTIGTVNLDFRSLFLHFENNSVFYDSSIIHDIENDMLSVFDQCLERKEGDGLPGSSFGFVEALLRVIAPLL